MNPGLVVKIRPTGPWRIGSDSGARNRVDAIYHSDSLYAAVASAMARLGMLPEWLDATARAKSPAVCFSSCFPFLDDIDFIVPPRTAWPPTQPGVSAHVRWKSARFVPVSLLQSILAGRKPDENKWGVDALSECLVPAGKSGPFRTDVRSNAAVDRLTGATERHSIACTEFRKGAGLWAIVSFADEAARDQWQAPVKAAFRWLADSGFGGERSRGWGRSEAPEFVEGALPEMVLGGQGSEEGGHQGLEPPLAVEEPRPAPPPETELPGEPTPSVQELQGEPSIEEPPAGPPQTDPPTEPEEGEASVQAPSEIAPLAVEPVGRTPWSAAGPPAGLRPEADEGVGRRPGGLPHRAPEPESEPAAPAEAKATEGVDVWQAESPASADATVEPGTPAPELAAEPEARAPSPQPPAPELAAEPEARAPSPQPPVPELAAEPEAPVPSSQPPVPELAAEPEARVPIPQPPAPALGRHWLLSLFAPAATDSVDWSRGNYSVMTRGGRVESAGELKKQLVMVAEGSVVCAVAPPQGAAPDVAPDGFAHPVYRAGFALTIPLPEAR